MVRNARELNGFPTLPPQQTARVSCDLGLRLLLRKVVSGLYFGHLTKEVSNLVRNSSHFTHFSPKENTRLLRQFSWGNWHFMTRTAIPLATKTRVATVIWTNCSVVKPSQEETLLRPGPVAQVESVIGDRDEKVPQFHTAPIWSYSPPSKETTLRLWKDRAEPGAGGRRRGERR